MIIISQKHQKNFSGKQKSKGEVYYNKFMRFSSLDALNEEQKSPFRFISNKSQWIAAETGSDGLIDTNQTVWFFQQL